MATKLVLNFDTDMDVSTINTENVVIERATWSGNGWTWPGNFIIPVISQVETHKDEFEIVLDPALDDTKRYRLVVKDSVLTSLKLPYKEQITEFGATAGGLE
jgi:hypothetical protein